MKTTQSIIITSTVKVKTNGNRFNHVNIHIIFTDDSSVWERGRIIVRNYILGDDDSSNETKRNNRLRQKD